MELKTVRQYADEHHVSYEAIRRQLQLYSAELEGHIVTQNGVRYLDEEAVKFLTERRRRNITVVRTENNQEELEKLRAETEKLKAQLAAAQTELLQAQKNIIELQTEQKHMIEAQTRYELQTEQLEETRTALQDAKKQLSDLKQDDEKIIANLMRERDKAQTEADSYTRSWFGFYRKR